MVKKLSLLLPSLLFLFSCGGGLGGHDDGEFGEEEHITGSHYQGAQCIQCHSFGGGTIFSRINAPDGDLQSAAAYYTVLLQFRDGTTYRAPRGRGSGNFQLPSNLKSEFIAKVLDPEGKEVNASQTYHTPDRYNCNACHTQNGANGAPGRIVSYDFYGGNR